MSDNRKIAYRLMHVSNTVHMIFIFLLVQIFINPFYLFSHINPSYSILVVLLPAVIHYGMQYYAKIKYPLVKNPIFIGLGTKMMYYAGNLLIFGAILGSFRGKNLEVMVIVGLTILGLSLLASFFNEPKEESPEKQEFDEDLLDDFVINEEL